MNKAFLIATCVLLPSTGAWAQVVFRSMVVQTQDGQRRTYDLQDVKDVTFSTEPNVMQCQWYQTLESPGIADYLRDFDYDPADYSYHHIFDYRGEPYLDERQDWPYGVRLGDTTYYNLIPNKLYDLKYIKEGEERQVKIQTLGQLRMIRAEGIDNVRDLGGWNTANGKHLRYGLLYRGTELNTKLGSSDTKRSAHRITATDTHLLRNELQIGAELDLRNTNEIPNPGHSALGEDIQYANYAISYTDIKSADNRQLILACFRFILSNLREHRPVYIHCIWGADRTGVLCMLLEGLTGVKQSDLDKEYELTSFSGNTRYRNNTYYLRSLNHILSLPGDGLQEKFRNWWLQTGATEAELEEFTTLMTE